MSAASWGLVVPAKGDPIVPFRNPFNNLAESMATALDSLQTYSFPRYATRSALPSTGNLARQHATVYADPTAGNNGDYYWNGTAWVLIGVFAEAAGTATYSSNIGNGASGSTTITFPTGRFTQIPNVTATTSQSRLTVAVSGKSLTGATITWSNWSGGTANASFTADWQAKQMTLASAAG